MGGPGASRVRQADPNCAPIGEEVLGDRSPPYPAPADLIRNSCLTAAFQPVKTGSVQTGGAPASRREL